MASAPVAAQNFTISASGNCGGTATNCGTPANRNGDRDTTWPGLQVDEGDIINFTVQANNVPSGAAGLWQVNMSTSGSAWNTSDLRSIIGTTITTPATLAIQNTFPNANRTYGYTAYLDSTTEPDETVTFSITAVVLPTSGTIGTPSSVTITIRGTDSAPSFGMGSVPAKTFTAGTAITEFQVPAATGGNGPTSYAASGLPAGLRFDATGTASPGCPGTEPREICGTPTTPTTGAATVTITATDADADDHGGSGGTVTFDAGETEAFIEVPILDDNEIEPAREFPRVRLLAPDTEADWALGLAPATVAIQEGVCDRSPEVRDALRGARECWVPGVRDLAGRGYLGLHRLGTGALRPKDFLGLPGLRILHLQGNRLAELPEGLLSGLRSLEHLDLAGNRLAELPGGLLDGLGRLSSLDLSGNRLAGLPAGLLSGAPSLSRLDLSGNRLASLPAGFFTGVSGLSELDLSDNPGTPFALAMELARTDAEGFAPGPAAVVARVREGAPFALSASLAAEGSAELSAETVRIGAGEASSAPLVVSHTGDGAVRLSLAGAPEVPAGLCGDVQDGQHPCFQGVRTEVGPGLVLFKRPPRLKGGIPGLEAESLSGEVWIDLSGFFEAGGDDVLTYAVESSDPSLASVSVADGILTVLPNSDGLEGLVTVTIVATDADGLTAEASLAVEVLPERRPFMRGWRLGWMAGNAK